MTTQPLPDCSVTLENVQKVEKGKVQSEKRTVWSQWMAAMTLSLVMLLIGLGTGWSSPYLAKLSLQENTDGLPRASDQQLSWVASLLNIARIFGAFAGVLAQEYIGRKNALYFAAVPMMSGWICMAVATSIEWLYIARILCGFSVGIVWSSLPHFLAEIAHPSIRGSLVLWNITTQSIGIFMGNLVGPYISMRFYACICIIVNALFLMIFPFIPDTPHRYTMLGNMEKAEKSLKWFRRSCDVKQELQELEDYIANSKCSFKERWKEMKEPRYRKSFLTMFLFNVFMFFCAYTVINTFMEIIVTRSKVTIITPNIVVTMCTSFAVLSSLLATCLVDRFGRRFLLICSSLGMAISLTCLGVHFKLLESEFDPVALTWLPMACLMAYTFSYVAGVGCIPDTMVGELFSPRLKSIASLTFGLGIAAFSSLSTVTFIPFLNFAGESYLFWFFACGTYVSALYYYFYAPETMGKSLKTIQDS